MFYLQALSSAGNTARSLPTIPFEEYVRIYKAIEENSGTGARSSPDLVYQTSEENKSHEKGRAPSEIVIFMISH